jgi:hypothetical protein
LAWDFKATGLASVDKGEFYPVYSVENGALIQNAPPPQLDAAQTAIARYDKESNGSYVVNGLNVTYLKTDGNEQTFIVAEGKAHVDGYEIELPRSLRVKLQKNPDIQAIESDPYTFQPEEGNSMTVVLNRSPINEITKVDATIEKTITMTHGSYTGALQRHSGRCRARDYPGKSGWRAVREHHGLQAQNGRGRLVARGR